MNQGNSKPALQIIRHANVSNTLRWQAKDRLSYKTGPHATVYLINGDRYIGNWKDNKRHGKGMHFYKKSGNVYEGEWENDQRQGFGTLSVPLASTESSDPTKPKPPRAKTPPVESESIFSSINTSTKKIDDTLVELRKVYAGAWANDCRHGIGTFFYDLGGVYEGSWQNDMREGWGRMTYPDGSVYEGEWHMENRHGQGILLMANGDRYEGMWLSNEKEGPGKFVYRTKRQVYEGEWTKGMPKCGMLKDLPPLPGQKDRQYAIPQIMLSDPMEILDKERQQIYEERIQRMMGGN
ncbi:hypothetical protein BATDEDRAFT_92863 [Batrachochytrium dendrobatidis JAM81]|uniref:MORN repeat-containing protein 3 n=2 Tax=Batrachochytrium dendrobatidis TaxID=109871 RepID=F4PEM7_BATDJ|nr:uncharacterized protein BATDEDRAFT_92863 [Batrachochytrium dendrobatidis JAM81]EGF76275.1 hypothetical protein BATDEDRAFT_92863 [Batrachochytrium dendrobatidis JAM81]KAJ8323661.1 hypothetical protein O5D80_007549 [Batrachochytrium dendrobatidis]KAK5666420.1 hypothetical protein QVD99_007175 [Batrachochytrium dendrobatidis]OAJ43023.1 hypothetical protein BDEG_26406 [Batrachochytrium dendrobatidis JEL423]|eukprot:XP_006683101.1 hypothetical protein BATDEDRAFT_92863 [Batrachochytrium dendrobatidis JAM81]